MKLIFCIFLNFSFLSAYAANFFDCLEVYQYKNSISSPSLTEVKKTYNRLLDRFVDPYRNRLATQINQLETTKNSLKKNSYEYVKIAKKIQRLRQKKSEITFLSQDLEELLILNKYKIRITTNLKDSKNIKPWLISQIKSVHRIYPHISKSEFLKNLKQYNLKEPIQKNNFLLYVDNMLKMRRITFEELWPIITSKNNIKYFSSQKMLKNLKFRFKYFSNMGKLGWSNRNKFYLPRTSASNKYEYNSIFKNLEKFLLDDYRPMLRLQELRKEVFELTKSLNISPDKAFIKVLDKWEKKGGFKPAFDMKDKFYTRKQFEKELIGSGALFNDITFAKKTGGFWTRHGEYSHRIQWNLVMREFLERPDLYLTTISGKQVLPSKVLFQMSKESVNRIYLGTSNRTYPRNNLWSVFFEFGPQNMLSPNDVAQMTKRMIPEAKLWTGLIDGAVMHP